MKIDSCTDKVVSDLVATLLPLESSIREKHVLREALNSLVRLAKSEQLLEVKNNVRRLTGPLTEPTSRLRLRSVSTSTANGWQQQFEFMKPE